MEFELLAKSFVILFVIMDPFASLPVFLAVTRGLSRRRLLKSADQAVLVAGVLLYAFLFFGNGLLSLFRISFSSFQVAGGVVLLLMALEIVLGLNLGTRARAGTPAGIVVIGTPLLTGPGVITTVTVLSQEAGVLATAIAGFAALACALAVLRNARKIRDGLGDAAVEALSKVMALLLAAVAVQMVRAGLGF